MIEGKQAFGEALFEGGEGFGGGGHGGESWPEICQTLPIVPPAAGRGPRNGRKQPVIALWMPDQLSVSRPTLPSSSLVTETEMAASWPSSMISTSLPAKRSAAPLLALEPTRRGAGC